MFIRIARQRRGDKEHKALQIAESYRECETCSRLELAEVLSRCDLSGEATFPAADLVRLMVVNRVCDPCSKLALLEWLDGVHFPGYEESHPSSHPLLRGTER